MAVAKSDPKNGTIIFTGGTGYRFSDYLRIGVPLNIILGLVTVALAPLIWAF